MDQEQFDLESLQNEGFDKEIIEDHIEEIIESEEEPTKVVEVEPEETIIIETEAAFPAFGATNDDLNHAILNNRDAHDQHPITAITGLRDELDQIESLQTVYSDKIRHADYFLWDDENFEHENRVGFFVASCTNNEKIKIYDGSNVFGITVPEAAFVGNQNDIERDDTYGLVASYGLIAVRCEADVVIGDFVVPNIHGVAAKSRSGYGYPVVAIGRNQRTTFATIVFAAQVDQLDELRLDLDVLIPRVEETEANIAEVTRVATLAHQRIEELIAVVQNNSTRITEAMRRATEALDLTRSCRLDIDRALLKSETAQTIAETAVSNAEYISLNIGQTANDALEGVNDLIDSIEPLMMWYDPSTGQTAAEYLVRYLNAGIPTTSEIRTLESTMESNLSSIDKNAEQLRSMVASVDKYSVGPYSTSYGLRDIDQAKSILRTGMVYVPSTTHTETYSSSSTSYTFEEGYYYTWDDDSVTGWVKSDSRAVVLSSLYTQGGSGVDYWFTLDDIFDDDGNILYYSDTLYKLVDGDWFAVATLSGNVNNRLISTVRQTANEISNSVQNTAGSVAVMRAELNDTESTVELLAEWKNNIGDDIESVASITERVSDVEASIESLTEWQSGAEDAIDSIAIISQKANSNEASISAITAWQDDTDASIALIDQTASDASASISQIVTNIGSNGTVTAASIIAAVEDGDSSIKLSADHIDLTGATFIDGTINVDDNFIVDQYGNLTLNGNITWGAGSSPTQAVYARTSLPKPANNTLISDFLTDDATDWHTNYNENDYYACWTYDGGSTWGNPIKIKATDGIEGYSSAIVYLYKRTDASSVSVNWTTTLTYNFTTHQLTSTPSGWSQTIPGGSVPLWVTTATAYSKTSTDTIAYTEWSAPVMLVKNGEDGVNGSNGSNGTNGLNTATIYLYKRSSTTPSTPSSGQTYTFSTAALSTIPSGWSRSVPTTGTDPIWVTQSTAVSSTTTDTIDGWSSPAILAKNGEKGDQGDPASVTSQAVYNALTNNSQYFGCFSAGSNSLYINANYINAGTLSANRIDCQGVVDAATITANSLLVKNGSTTLLDAGYTSSSAVTIGGWTVGVQSGSSNGIYKTSGSSGYTVGMQSGTSPNNLAFYVKQGTFDSPYDKFYVRNNGDLYAANATIVGSITATSGSFSRDVTIGGRSLSQWITSSGYVSDIEVVSGTLGACHIDAVGLRAGERLSFYETCDKSTGYVNRPIERAGVYIAGSGGLGSMEQYGGISLGTGRFQIGTSYGFGNQFLYGTRHVFVGTKTNGSAYYKVSINNDSIYFAYTTNSSLLDINSDSETIRVGSISTSGTNMKMYGDWRVVNSLIGDSPSATVSDPSKKNTIEEMPDEYDNLFDGLVPVRFKYNNGTSNRYHTGFITDNVKSAITESGLTEKDFAAVADYTEDDGTVVSTLRYDEFVSLNTWQIQKLKERVAQLEEKLANLES